MSGKRLVLFVEGEGDELAVPVLVKRLIGEYKAWDVVNLDPAPFRAGEVGRLYANWDGKPNWERWLQAACKRQNIGGVLVVVDGDAPQLRGKPFCAANVARELSARATKVGAGKSFSVAVVFAMMEYETWLRAGIASLAGKTLPNERPGVKQVVDPPENESDIEIVPRDAKGWLSKQMENGYKPSTDQAPLTAMVDLSQVRARELRSFKRLEDALIGLIGAFRSGTHVCTPSV